MRKPVCKTSVHIPYTLSDKNKFAHYEQQWKVAAVRLLNEVYTKPEERKWITVLDFGCGRGELLKLLGENNYGCYGIDVDEECVRLSSRYASCQKGGYQDLPKLFLKESFDVVISLHVLEHMENPKECVEFLSKVSRKYLLFAVPNLAKLCNLSLRRIGRISNRGHICGWDYPHFENLLTNYCALRIVQWDFDVVRLPDLPRKVDRLLHLTGLRKLIEEGFLLKMFPFLSNSLIVLCEK